MKTTDKIRRSGLPIPFPDAPFLTRVFSPAGPATPCVTESRGARVISIPGRYSVTQIVEGPRALVLADVGSVSDIPLVERAAEWVGKPVGLVVPTHLHFDHIMGVDEAARRFGAAVALGELANTLVDEERKPRPPIFKTLKHFFVPWFWQGLPLFSREDIPGGLAFGFPWSRNPFTMRGPLLQTGKPVPMLEGWVTLHTPGHTDESICIYHPRSGFLVAGDTVRNYQGGEWNPIITDHAMYRDTIFRLLPLPVRAVFPGHGPVLTGERLLGRLRPFDSGAA
ncbi:MAG: MBL fold metallo-hydrolase [Deltaproteobacteria bacterium]|nr:MBL fold metallo-hydrolase [Deltaproteobacteria bacterium]